MIIFLKIMFLLQEGSNKATQSPYASNIWESNGCLMLIRVNRTGNPFTVVSGIPQAEPQSKPDKNSWSKIVEIYVIVIKCDAL